MSVDLLNPVVLVVKAPNQQIADQTVECALDWTIRKLKDHLARVYPSQPRQEQQKLIYYGRLLLDHLTLKDVLKQYEGQSTYTVHLVCAGSQANTSTKSDQPQKSSMDTPVNQLPDTDGLRRRAAVGRDNDAAPPNASAAMAPPSPDTPSIATQLPNAYMNPALMNYYQQLQMYNPQMMGMNVQQMMMYQQMYAQQMAQYMQYWQTLQLQQHSSLTPPPLSPGPHSAAPLAPEHLPGAAPAAAAAPVVEARAEQRANNNANMVMNAQGGAAMFEDDDDEGEQDWLDWFYTACRFAVLIMIIYFYSTIPRAITGLLFFFFIYIYQQGWFNVQRRAVPAPVIAPAAVPAPVPAPAPVPDSAPVSAEDAPEDGQLAEEDASKQDADTAPDNDAVSPPEQEIELPQFSRVYVAWVFFKTFFTSLLPRPAAVV